MLREPFKNAPLSYFTNREKERNREGGGRDDTTISLVAIIFDMRICISSMSCSCLCWFTRALREKSVELGASTQVSRYHFYPSPMNLLHWNARREHIRTYVNLIIDLKSIRIQLVHECFDYTLCHSVSGLPKNHAVWIECLRMENESNRR